MVYGITPPDPTLAGVRDDKVLEIIINYVVWWITQPQYEGTLDMVEEYIRGYLT